MTHEKNMTTVVSSSTDPASSPEVDCLICASMAASSRSVYEQMETIRQLSIQRNAHAGIHTVLLYQGGWFLWWAEGPHEALKTLVAKLRIDKRHHSLRTIHHSKGPRTLPSPWSMMMTSTTESPQEIGQRIQAQYVDNEHGIRRTPTSVLRRIVTPFLMPQAQQMTDPESYHRVGICASVGAAAFDFVRWLAAENEQPHIHRRVAGESDADSASTYVELAVMNEPCRVIAVSRRALLHGVFRAFLADWPHLLVLVSGDAERDDSLLLRLNKAFHGLSAVPRLIGVAPHAAIHTRMVEQAEALGLRYQPAGQAKAEDWPAVMHALLQRIAQFGPPPSSLLDAGEQAEEF